MQGMHYDLSSIMVFMICRIEIESLQKVGNQLSICSSTFQLSMADMYRANNAGVNGGRPFKYYHSTK